MEAQGTEDEQDEVTGIHTGLQDMNVEDEGPVVAAGEDEANTLLVSQVKTSHFNDQRVIQELTRRGHHQPTLSAGQRKKYLIGLLSVPVASLATSSGDVSLICVTGLSGPLRA